jgi:CIC family chloride channel protein
MEAEKGGAEPRRLQSKAKILWKAVGIYVLHSMRSREWLQIGASAVIGGFIGVVVELLRRLVQWLHRVDFDLPPGELLSTGIGHDAMRVLLVPALGGLLLGLLAIAARRFRARDIVDPIEANALYGGRMSLWDSIRLTFDTLVSNASGASLGMEAGYSQLGAGVFSSVAHKFELRRADHRIFVTAGAAAAIAAAYNAPLAGLFYGFELILSGYLPHALGLVAAAVISATLVQRTIGQEIPLFATIGTIPLDNLSYVLFGLVGVFAAFIAILAMKAVTSTENLLRDTKVPYWLRPFLGGIALSAIAYFFPQVLGSGHGAIEFHFQTHIALLPLVGLLVAKLLASAVSVGSGFRGGLFSSSLFLGAVFGAICADVATYLIPSLTTAYEAFLIVGMGSVAAAIVGAPLTMVFLVLEATGNAPITAGTLVGVIIAVTITRVSFGFSFSTWRFHVRGKGIRGAYDVGWIADLTVARLMRTDPKVVPISMTLRELREAFPPGSAKYAFTSDPEGNYAGTFDLGEIYDRQYDDVADFVLAADLAGPKSDCLLPMENVRAAMMRFEETRLEALPVLAAGADPRVIGYLTEAYALRRYTEEMERRRNAELGQRDLFSIK